MTPDDNDAPLAAVPAARPVPISMALRPESVPVPVSGEPNQPLPGELPESFESALARVGKRSRRPSGGWWRRLLGESKTRRTVAFDGFRDDLYDEKLERDRRYGTVYTVIEHVNAYLVQLEMPRRLASSSLRAVWDLPLQMPDYDYTVALASNAVTIKASLPNEALRRLSYISTSFPADFMTRIEFSQPVGSFVHRLRHKLLEIIVFKRVGAQDANHAPGQ
jgi:hypothetical protein